MYDIRVVMHSNDKVTRCNSKLEQCLVDGATQTTLLKMDELTTVNNGSSGMHCGRQFVEGATRQPIGRSTCELIDKLLLERLSHKCDRVRAHGPKSKSAAAISAIASLFVSQRWLQYYINQKYYQTSKYVEVIQKKLAA